MSLHSDYTLNKYLNVSWGRKQKQINEHACKLHFPSRALLFIFFLRYTKDEISLGKRNLRKTKQYTEEDGTKWSTIHWTPVIIRGSITEAAKNHHKLARRSCFVCEWNRWKDRCFIFPTITPAK